MYPDRTSRNKKEIENQAIPIAMPSGVSGADVTHAVVTAPSMGDSSLSTHTEDNLVPLPPLSPLRSVWDCPRLKRGQSQGVEKKGKSNGWQCGHCDGVFYPDHATRAAHHLAQQRGGSIVVCSAVIPEREKARCVFLVLLSFSPAHL